MTVKSHKKELARVEREARIESHRKFQRDTQAARLEDDLGEQVGLVFVKTNGMTHYEEFPDRKVTAVGVDRAEYLTRTFPDNFKRQKLTEALKEEIAMRTNKGAENKMQTGAGAENKTTDDGDPINDSGGVEIVPKPDADGDGDVELDESVDDGSTIEATDIELVSVGVVSNPPEGSEFGATVESSDEVTTETETESADDAESTRQSDS